MNKILPIILVVLFSSNVNSGWFDNDIQDMSTEDFKDRRVIPREEMPTCNLPEKQCFAAEVVCGRDPKVCLFKYYPTPTICRTIAFTQKQNNCIDIDNEIKLVENQYRELSVMGSITEAASSTIGAIVIVPLAIITAPFWLFDNEPSVARTVKKKKGIDINLDFLDTPSEKLNKMNLPNEPYRPHESDVFDYDSGPEGMYDSSGGADG
jgi:hypothetical protein